MFKLKSNIDRYFFSALLLILFISEACFKVLDMTSEGSFHFLKYIKLGVLSFIVVGIFYLKPSKLFLPITIFLTFICGQVIVPDSFKQEILVEASKYLYLVLLLVFFNAYPSRKDQLTAMFKTFEVIIFFNSLLIIFGFLFDIFLFKTYQGKRFGYNGLLVSSATGSYVYIISYIYLLVKHEKTLFTNFFALIIIAASLLVGTKAIYIFFFGFLLYYAIYYSPPKLKIGILISTSIILPIITYMFFYKYALFNNIRMNHGIISALMSYRDQLFFNETLPFIKSNWNVLNYLFGGIADIKTRSQMELVDIFYFFGIIGGLLYLYTFKKFFLEGKLNRSIKTLLLFTFGIILFAGNFFGYASVAIYVVVLSEFLKEHARDKVY